MTTMNTEKRGFTLIEVVIYLALFTILMGGAVVAAYSLFEAGGKNQTKAMVQEEGDFLLAKFEWAFSSGVASVSVSGGGETLTLTPLVGPSILIDVLSTGMHIDTGTGPLTLNNSSVTFSESTDAATHTPIPYFVFTSASPTSFKHIRLAFTLSARAPNGMVMSQDFAFTGYVH